MAGALITMVTITGRTVWVIENYNIDDQEGI